ncbi:NUDIX domain-containing protein [Candidatus Shapirobacteria bacterium]|nr:NUDIX domain-containing protein [Candidatus Shapirobacteria bacterium]
MIKQAGWIDFFHKLPSGVFANEQVRAVCQQKIEAGIISRDDNPVSHFVVFFLPYNPATKQVYLVFNLKIANGLWLFPGGHIDQSESAKETLIREAREELGLKLNEEAIKPPFLNTHTKAKDSRKPCVDHYDIWYLIKTSGKDFVVTEEEFVKPQWVSLDKAKELVTEPTTTLALNKLSFYLF